MVGKSDSDDMLDCLANCVATINAIHQWVDMVDDAGGATTIPGVAKLHAMMNSFKRNRLRIETLIIDPANAAIAKARGEA